MIATDTNGVIVYWNQSAEHLYGWSSEEVLGVPVSEVLVPRYAQEQAQQIMGALGEGETWTGRFVVRHRDGRPLPIRIVDTPVTSPDGEVVAIVGVANHAPVSAVLIDPDASTRMLIADLLEDEGVSVHVASGAPETTALCRSVAIDLVISEARLSDGSALELHEALRRDGYTGSFLLVSAWPEAAEIAETLGILRVAKPFDLDELGVAVRTAVGV